MDLSRMNESVELVGGFNGEPFKFYAEVRKPTVKDFISGDLPSEQTSISFFTWFAVSNRLNTGSKLKWRGETYDVSELSADYGSYEYVVIKCVKTNVKSSKNPFATYQ